MVSIPLPLLKELYEHFAKIEEILATLEELTNKEGLERVEKSLEEYEKIWRWRIGKHRIIYLIDEKEKAVAFLDVGLRKAIYE